MAMRANEKTGYPGRGYRYFTGSPVYRFGQGMSYTTFKAECNHTIIVTDAEANAFYIEVSCNVTNVGAIGGDEVLLLFHKPPPAAKDEPQHPIRRLVGFDRVTLSPDCSTTVLFSAKSKQLSFPDEFGSDKGVLPGLHHLVVGDDESNKFSFDISSIQ